MEQNETPDVSTHADPESDGTSRFRCPGCEEDLDIPNGALGNLVRCPYCNTDFFAADEHIHSAVVDDTPQPADVDREFEINRVRIRQYAALRRGAIRARSWWVVTQWTCLFTVVDILGQIFIYLTTWHRWGWAPTIGAAVLPAAGVLGFHARRHAKTLELEIKTSALADPQQPPDFSTLSDGSDFLTRFDRIR